MCVFWPKFKELIPPKQESDILRVCLRMSEKEIQISSQMNLNMDFIFLNGIPKPRSC